MDEKKFLTVEEVAEILRIGRTKAYELVKEPGFPAIKVGNQIRIMSDELYGYLKNRQE